MDTNFIISCIRKKIDFLEQLNQMGFKAVIPREVFEELKDLKKRDGTPRDDRIAIDVAFQMLEKEKVGKMRLGHVNVDEGLIKKGKEGIYIASLDNHIKKEVPNRIIIKDAEKTIAIERD